MKIRIICCKDIKEVADEDYDYVLDGSERAVQYELTKIIKDTIKHDKTTVIATTSKVPVCAIGLLLYKGVLNREDISWIIDDADITDEDGKPREGTYDEDHYLVGYKKGWGNGWVMGYFNFDSDLMFKEFGVM